jgi:hypothetical protein
LLLSELHVLDLILDHFLVASPLLGIAPPHWPLVFAAYGEFAASFATWLAFITLLSS